MAGMMKVVGRVAASLLFAGLICAQQRTFDGTWQMDTAKSHVNDGRAITLTTVSVDEGIKMTIKTRKGRCPRTATQFSSKLNGKPSEFAGSSHKSQSRHGTAGLL